MYVVYLQIKDRDGLVSFSLKISNAPICPLYRSNEIEILKQIDIYKSVQHVMFETHLSLKTT